MIEKRQSRFFILDLLRGLAAFGIILFHLAGETSPISSLFLLVDFFFVLSGFVLYSQLPKSRQPYELRDFARARFKRLIPTAWLCIFLSYLTYFILQYSDQIASDKALPVSIYSFLGALLFLQFVLPYTSVLIVPMWSLSVEIFTNLLFAFAGARRLTSILFALISGTSLYFNNLNENLMDTTSGWIALMRGIYGFSLGLVARDIFERHYRISLIKILISGTLISAVLLLVTRSSVFAVSIAPAMALFVYAASKFRFSQSKFTTLCSKMGEYSYGVYLWHFPIIYFVSVFQPQSFRLKHFLVFKVLEFLTVLTVSLVLTGLSLAIFRSKSKI
jgi:peptidoglycan/LPS O-acetylase OafA/YrhL